MRFLILLLTLATFVPGPGAHAGDRGDGGGGGGRDSSNTVNNRTTREVVRLLESGVGECLQLFEAYRFDCIRKTYGFAARKIKGGIDYQPAYEALRSVEKRVEAAVNANADPTAKRIRKGLVRYSAVKPAAIAAVKRETIRAMEDASTVLLRSPAPHQKPHFQKIAAVIDSNKVLLRSALLRGPVQLYRLALGLWPVAQLSHRG